MYIFKSDPSDGSDDSLLKSSKTSLSASQAAENMLARLQAPVVAAPIASLSAPLPTGIVLSNLIDSVALAGVISTIGQPANQSFAKPDHAALMSAQHFAEEKFSKEAQGLFASALSDVKAVPISSLAETMIAHQPVTAPENAVVIGASSPVTFSNQAGVIDLSTLPAGTPVVITQLSDAGSAVTVIHESSGNVRIADFQPIDAVSQTFINTGLGVLTVTTPATKVSSLSLNGNVEFTATGIEVTSGITVSGESDSSNVALYITGGASSASGSSDVINLGDGNNFVFNAGDGAIFINLGLGANSVILAGVGASGVVNLATNDAGRGDFVAIAANGLSDPNALAAAPLVTITGLNGGDAISFLSDMGSDLSWAAGSAQSAQVQTARGDAANLASWIAAAQAQASAAHTVAWFQFDGATYIYESVGNASNHNGDTLVKLTGTINLADGQVELSQGLLQLLG